MLMMRRTAIRARGFSIVEAMVALVVMSVGMLGIAGLYVSSLKAGRTAILRTQAVNLASDIADRIRANRTARNAYDTAAVAPCSVPGGGATLAETTARNLAAADTCQWVANIQAILPQGNGVIGFVAGVPAGMPNNYVVTVSWQEPGEQQVFTYQLRVQAS
jgi:type IV pilus assembly protein PilV